MNGLIQRLLVVSLLAGTTPGLLEAASLRLTILPQAGDQALPLDSPTLKNAAGEAWSVTRLSYLLSGLSLQRQDGTWQEVPGAVAWMNATTNRDQWLVSGLPAGRYQALRFHIGLEPVVNDKNPASWAPDHPLNPNVNGLHWSMLGGYIFLALEGRYSAGDSTAKGYALHLAREPFRTAITVPVALDLREGMDSRLTLEFDVSTVINGPQPVSFAADGASTHSKDEDPLALALKHNLSTAFRAASPASNAAATPTVPENLARELDLPKSFSAYAFTLPATFPIPALPKTNPLINERVELGKKLFHETALSRDGSLSCASCHFPAAALSDPRQFSSGVEGRLGNRNAMPLFNLAWKSDFFWDGRATGLSQQVLMPIQDHREMDENLERVVEKLAAQPRYPDAFAAAFGGAQITPERMALALENFLLTLTSHDSRFDRSMRGEVQLSDQEKRGFELFMTEREPRLGSMGGDCFHCHGGALFTDHQFRNNGLAIDESDLGRFLVTQKAIDRGTFSTPSLRNVALTAPYMHDGRFSSLEQVLDHYSEGVQRTDTLDPNLAKHPDGGLQLSAEDKQALIAFLNSLSDDHFSAALTADP